jgi:hypothetical protein
MFPVDQPYNKLTFSVDAAAACFFNEKTKRCIWIVFI